MECPNCQFVVSPGVEAVGGVCPNCDRPYRTQPTPVNSEMEMRNMPAPGEEDMGGNPLQEGILGDYQNRGVRDESYASVRSDIEPPLFYAASELTPEPEWPEEDEPDIEIPADLVTVVPPSKRSSMEKDAIGFDDVAKPFEDAGKAVGDVAEKAPGIVKDVAPHVPLGMLPGVPPILPSFNNLKDAGQWAWQNKKPIGIGLGAAGLGALTVATGGAAAPLDVAALEGAGGAAAAGEMAAGGAAAGEAGASAAAAGEAGAAATPAAESMGAGLAGEGATGTAATATRGGVGSLMKSGLGKGYRAGRAMLLGNAAHDALLGGGGSQPGLLTGPGAGAAPMMGQPQPASFYSSTPSIHTDLLRLLASVEDDLYPGSHDEIPAKDIDDPEKIDPHEKNQGQRDMDLQVGMGVDDMGGTDQGPDGLFGAGGDAMQQFALAFPTLLHYLTSEESGEGDPIMQALHEALEQEHPGYLNDANDEHGDRLLGALFDKDDGDDPLLQDNEAPHDPLRQAGIDPGVQSTCMKCGGMLDPSTKRCPQCGMSNMIGNPQSVNTNQDVAPQPISRVADNTQGPVTDEQKSAVTEYLQAAGRDDEIATMIREPWNYAKELSQITGQEEPPQPLDPSQQPPPPVTPPVAPGPEMGMAPPPGGMPPAMAMSRAANRAAMHLSLTVDAITGPCPKCGSHSTGIMDEDGTAGCKSCGHQFKNDHSPAEDPKLKDGSVHVGDDSQVIDAPAADQVRQFDPEHQEDSSLTWQDSQGQPIRVGQKYRLTSLKYDVPDIVRVSDVKPDSVNFDIISEFGLDAPTEVSREEFDIMKYKFEPMGDDVTQGQPDLQENPDDRQPGRPGPGDQTDLSTPHELMSHTEASYGTGPDWLAREVKEAGAKLTPMEQRAFIDEDGTARNSDLLDLSGTHYEMATELEDSFLW